jgi:hypothetical protein
LRQNAADLSDACRSVFEQSAGQQKQMSDWRAADWPPHLPAMAGAQRPSEI